jgi:hypothetical protein
MNTKLTLEQYLKAAFFTGIYPGDGRTDRELRPEERLKFEQSLTVKLHITNSAVRPEALAESLVERDGQVTGIFRTKDGKIYSGTWSDSSDGFLGTFLPASDIVPIEVDYETPARVYPTEATDTACDGSEVRANPIFLFQGRPTRQVKDGTDYINYTWKKLHRRSMGWVKRVRSGAK